MDYIIYYAISGFVFGFVCNAILKDKGYGTDENPNYGFWWGFVFGVLGLVVCVCKKRIETSASTNNGDVEDIEKWVCPNCGKENPIHFFECECGYQNRNSQGLSKPYTALSVTNNNTNQKSYFVSVFVYVGFIFISLLLFWGIIMYFAQ